MTRIEIRLPGAGPAQVLAHFAGQAEPMQEAVNPIAQQALGPAVSEAWLAAGPIEQLQHGRFHVSRSPHYQFAQVAIPTASVDMRRTTESAYRELLALIAGSQWPQLVRFWNYVPQINAGVDDAEVYRQFCWGRAEALEIDELALPAATAIGSADGVMRISALSARPELQVRHLENPRQVSAYHYPRQYGPRSPSFARATEISVGEQALLLLSGTSSIVHHETCHPDNLCAQTAETRRNIQELLATASHAETLKPLHFRFYLRHATDLQAARSSYSSSFPDFPEPAYVQGDICRAALMMEIDGVFSTAG